MKKLLLVFFMLGTLGFASEPASAQIVQNSSFYATPAWNQQIPAATRFIIQTDWGSAAVLDRETGLLWERTPASATSDWVNALYSCRAQLVGNRRGWRLPSYEELTSLLDPTQSNPALPAGIFLGIGPSDDFWTTSTDEGDADAAWIVEIASATTNLTALKNLPTNLFRSWCVRGGSSVTNPPY
ncbi:MAG: DUF1566 domain-containing protein [Steroidobacteraceae bacterium]